jgi:hypothetical protein
LVPKLAKPSPVLGVLLALEGDGCEPSIVRRLLFEAQSNALGDLCR